MHAVCETHEFRRAADDAGMTSDEVMRLALVLSENPDAGDLIVGTGGARKLRFPDPVEERARDTASSPTLAATTSRYFLWTSTPRATRSTCPLESGWR